MKKRMWDGGLRFGFAIAIVGLLFNTGCVKQSPVQVVPTETARPTFTVTPSPVPTEVSLPPETPTPLPTLVSSACSPLENIGFNELDGITSFEFNSPSAYSDAFHPGVDLAFFSFKEYTTMRGHPVQAVLPGKVVLVIDDRFPYGNSILIETPLELVGDGLREKLTLPTPIPQREIDLFSTCSKEMPAISWSGDMKSLYVLYAHLAEKPAFQMGETVACGETIGKVGISGNSIADHLHLEMRLGPSDAGFGTFAALRPEASAIEKYNYCIWNSSGYFQAVNPALIWQ